MNLVNDDLSQLKMGHSKKIGIKKVPKYEDRSFGTQMQHRKTVMPVQTGMTDNPS